MTDLQMHIDPSRPKAQFRPFKAMGHMNRLIANKEDTAQVFHIIEALNGDTLTSNFKLFLASEEGQKRFTARRDLAVLLDDHAALGDLPADSTGRAYIDFMQREGLTAKGLVEESNILKAGQKQFDDDLRWFGDRLRDTHDMFHVLSGYGRDALGEAALLAFSHGQTPGRGVTFISRVAFWKMRQELGQHIDFKSVEKEARANGRAAGKILEQDILAMLKLPLSEVRAELNIKEPIAYKAAMKAFFQLPQSVRDMALV